MGLGMFTGVACSSRSAWHPGWKGFMVLAGIHVLLVGCGYSLAKNSHQNGARMSPGGLSAGFVLAYVAGLIITLFL